MNAEPKPIPFKAEGPQPLMREIPPGDAYPVDALGPLRAVVEAVQDISQAPVGIAAQSALAVASLAVQGFADVETLGGDAPCSLFCLTIAESGERKSTCDRLLMRGVRNFERDQDHAYRDDLAAHDTVQKVWAEKKKRMIADAAGSNKDKATAATADLLQIGAEPKPPLFPSLTAMDPTFEGLVKLYQIGRPALGLFTDEAGGFIGGHAMNSDNRLKTMAGLSRLWNGEPIDRTRAGDGATTYRGRRLAAHLMVQPVAARPLLSDPQAAGQGFLARFLITEPASHIGTRLRRGHRAESDAAVERFADQLLDFLQTPLPTGVDRQELAPSRLPLSWQAKELLWRFHEAIEAKQGPGGELEQARAFASKAVEQACRIAGVQTLWADLDAPEITAEAMARGIQLAAYYLGEAKRLAEVAAVSAETDRAEHLRKWILNTWPRPMITIRDIVRGGPNRLRDGKAARETVAILERAGWLVRLPEGTEFEGMARKEIWQVVRP
jgi:Protein of unknown function (DUF3987)